MVPPPTQWGLRGDPILWHMMSDALADMPLPVDRDKLRMIIQDCFLKLTNHAVADAPNALAVPATHRANGGMSRGMICGPFWRDTGLPLILSRFDEGDF